MEYRKRTGHQKKIPISVPFFFPFQPFRSSPFHYIPFSSVLTVYRGQTVSLIGMNLSAKFTVRVGET